MPERDAFGNELRPSDATAAFGAAEPVPAPAPATGGPVEPRAPAAPVAPPAPVLDTTRPSSRSPGPRRASGRAAGGCIVFVVVVLGAGGLVVGLVADQVSTGVDAVRSLSTEFDRTAQAPRTPAPTPSTPSTPSRPAPPAAPPTGLRRGSLLRPVPFGRAVTRLRRSGLGRLRNLRVSPARIDAQLVTSSGRLRSVEIVPGGKLTTLSTSSTGFGSSRTLSLAAIDRKAPQRLARSAAGRARTSTGAVEYLVLLDLGGQPGWVVYLRGGRGFRADRNGRGLLKIG